MKIVGLTGGIGSGKSTVADFFRELGVPVYNSDKEAKKLMTANKEVKKAIVELLGKKAYKGKELNKKFISQEIFNDRFLLAKINGIVHPAVREHFMAWAKKQKTAYVIQETALIFENQMRGFYNHIILVTTPLEIRLERIILRDGASKEAIYDRMKNQLTDEEKTPFSDDVIVNIDLAETRLRVKEVHNALLANS